MFAKNLLENMLVARVEERDGEPWLLLEAPLPISDLATVGEYISQGLCSKGKKAVTDDKGTELVKAKPKRAGYSITGNSGTLKLRLGVEPDDSAPEGMSRTEAEGIVELHAGMPDNPIWKSGEWLLSLRRARMLLGTRVAAKAADGVLAESARAAARKTRDAQVGAALGVPAAKA